MLKDEEITNFFARFKDNPIDVLVHAIAFAPNEMFTEPPSDTTADGFCLSLTISAHSLCKAVRFASGFTRLEQRDYPDLPGFRAGGGFLRPDGGFQVRVGERGTLPGELGGTPG